jgi:hypothetical protein
VRLLGARRHVRVCSDGSSAGIVNATQRNTSQTKTPKPAQPSRLDEEAFRRDKATFESLVESHSKIRRTIKQLFDGVDTITESDDPAIVALIKEHVPAMYARLKSGRIVHEVDPLFKELFKNGSKIDQRIILTDKGVEVIEMSNDPYVVKLIKAHAASVNDLVKDGMAAFMKLHKLPKR